MVVKRNVAICILSRGHSLVVERVSAERIDHQGVPPEHAPGDPAGPLAVLIERDAELERLDALIEDVLAGRGRVVAIEGPAGIGKSSLVAALARQRARTASAS